MIERSWAEAHLPLVLSILKGSPISAVERTGNEGVERPFVVDPSSMQRYEMYAYTRDGYKPNPNIPENSVGIIPISGPITKYNGDCGEPGAIQQANYLMDMNKRSNIGSVLMLMDTPGGEARAANILTGTMNSMNKPVLSLVDGMSASLGMWITAGSKETYLSSSLDQVGSVGSYVMLADFTGMLEKEGIKLHEIYAPQSEDKNRDYKDAMKGDYSAIKKDLGLHVDAFINYIKTQRPQSAATQSEWGTGKMFYAAEAKQLGLADGVRSFEQVVSKAAWLGKRNK